MRVGTSCFALFFCALLLLSSSAFSRGSGDVNDEGVPPGCEAAIDKVAADYRQCLARADTRHARDENAEKLERRQAHCERRFERRTARVTGLLGVGECPVARNPLEPRLGDRLNEMFTIDLTLDQLTIATVGNIVHTWDETERVEFPWVPSATGLSNHNQHFSSSSFINNRIHDPDGEKTNLVLFDPFAGGIVWGGDALVVGCVYSGDADTEGSRICSCQEIYSDFCNPANPRINVYLQAQIDEQCSPTDGTAVCPFSYCDNAFQPAVEQSNCPLIPNDTELRLQQSIREVPTAGGRYGEVAVLFSRMELEDHLSVNYLTKVQAFFVSNVEIPGPPDPGKKDPLRSCKVWQQMKSTFPIGSIGPDLYRLHVFDSSSAPWELIAVWENADTFNCNSITFRPIAGQ